MENLLRAGGACFSRSDVVRSLMQRTAYGADVTTPLTMPPTTS